MNRCLFIAIPCLVLSIFTVSRAQPDPAVNPFPANNAVDVPANVVLHWDAADGAEFYDLYLASFQPLIFVGALTDTFYDQPFDFDINLTYYWRVDTRNASGTTQGELWQFTTPAMAPQATNPFPADGATGVATNAVLSWSPSPGTWWYDLQFGDANPPPYVGFQAETTYTPGTLSSNTTYYWVVSPGSAGGSTQGELWSFTTGLPALPQATNPDPADGATDIPIDLTCTWSAVTGAQVYHVYFGTTDPPPYITFHAETEFIPVNVQYNTTYYWKVNPANQTQETEGEIWSFTTIGGAPPDTVINPQPEHHGEDVPIDVTLHWAPANGATSYSINFGPQFNPPQIGTTADTLFSPGQLEPETDYYWRVNSINQYGQTNGTIWMFTTEATGAVGNISLVPTSTTLGQPYPNPFNAETTIPFTLAASQHVTLAIYDITGREISTLANTVLSAGEHTTSWNSSTAASGVYFVRLTTGSETFTAKILALK